MPITRTTLLGAAFLLLFLITPGRGQNVPAPAAAEGAPATASVGRGVPPANYQLSPGDTVTIRVFREPDLDTQQRLSRDGTINFPLIGVIHLGGKNTNEASAMIVGMLAPDYILHPQVSVAISTYTKQQFTVLGQVGNPGTYAIPEEQQSIDLLGAVARAGGFTRLAKNWQVIVRRSTPFGQEQTFTVDARRMLQDRRAERFVIQANDVISVPERFF